MEIDHGLLARHVRMSNLIEGIVAFRGEPYYDSHLDAASCAARGTLTRPLELHRILCAGTPMESFGGSYRTCRIYVGSKEMPAHEHVPFLMDEWWACVEQFSAWATDQSPEEIEGACELLHHYLLCIHPFQDGNGRASRLALNMLRTNARLPWLLIRPWEKREYVGRIRWFEEEVFKHIHPDVYPEKEAECE